MSLTAKESGVHGDEAVPAHTTPRDELFKMHRFRNNVAFWFLGFINNYHYCLAISAADDLSTQYGMKKYIALIGWANVFFGIVARILNTFVCTQVPYNIRIGIMCAATILGILLVSFSREIGRGGGGSFAVVVIGVIFSGTASNYGESVLLGYLEGFPEILVGAWSSGTGMSGVLSTAIYLGLVAAKLSPGHIFLISLPFSIAYFAMFMFVIVYPKMKETATIAGNRITDAVMAGVEGPAGAAQHTGNMLGFQRAVLEDDDISNYQMVTNFFHSPWWWPKEAKEVDSSDQFSEREPAPRGVNRALANVDGSLPPMVYPERSWRAEAATSCCPPVKRTTLSLKQWWKENGADIRSMHSVTLWYNFNLGAVYIAEYAAQFMTPFAFPCDATKKPGNFFLVNAYAICQFCYQFGVLIARSSLWCVRIKFVGVISIIQTINAILWLVQAKTLFISSSDEHKELSCAFGLFVWMIFVGLMGGTSYVNVFYLVLRRTKKLELGEEMDVTAAYKEEKQKLVGGDVEDDGEGGKEGGALSPERTAGASSSPASPSYPAAASAIFNVAGEDEEAEDTRAIDLLRAHVAELWRRRRELAMNIGALYATVGITIGTIIDVILTATIKSGC